MSEPVERKGSNPNDLFARARDGDQAAWEELFNTCYPKVVRSIRRRLNPPMRSLYDSTDFASDVWKSLAANCGRFDFPTIDNLLAFLMKAAEDKLKDEYRRCHALKRDMSREQRIEAGSGEGNGSFGLHSSDPTPSQVALADEGYERVRSGLPEDARKALDLKRQGHTTEEIAGELGWHLRKVQRLFKNLEDRWPDAGGGR